jgi:hypothetical protein
VTAGFFGGPPRVRCRDDGLMMRRTAEYVRAAVEADRTTLELAGRGRDAAEAKANAFGTPAYHASIARWCEAARAFTAAESDRAAAWDRLHDAVPPRGCCTVRLRCEDGTAISASVGHRTGRFRIEYTLLRAAA